MIRVLSIFLFFSSLICSAQNEANLWYFGDSAALDFTGGTPVAMLNSSMRAGEGCATLNDTSGNLICYTNGETVWNKNHVVMMNGTGLMGDYNSTQSALIIPFPGDPDKYYIFTIGDFQVIKGLRYSILDLSLDGGIGGITTKNSLLLSNCSEQLTGIQHCNREDFWIVVHPYATDLFYAYPITSAGIQPAVITQIGSMFPSNGFPGYLKFSPDGKRLALAGYVQLPVIQLYDFDNTTGILTNLIDIQPADASYGIEFSPNQTKIYVSHQVGAARWVDQFDITSNDALTINSTKYEVVSFTPEGNGALQLGVDGKIYFVRQMSGALDVINNPNESGPACNYTASALSLGGKSTLVGLPQVIANYLYDFSAEFSFSPGCAGSPVTFLNNSSQNQASWNWNFDDPASGIENSSTLKNPEHTFTAVGIYDVTLVITDGCKFDTTVQTVVIGNAPTIELGSPKEICEGESYLLNAGMNGMNYSWSTGETSQTISIDSTGLYSITVTDPGTGCNSTDSVLVNVNLLPLVSAWPDTTIIAGASVLLNSSGGVTCAWSPPVGLSDALDCNPTAGPEKTTTYTVTVIDSNGCKNSANVTINVELLISIFIPNVFSPNSDGSNDFFRIYGDGIKKLELDIFNRWGERTFSTNNLAEGWDGKFNGQLLANEVFTYSADVTFTDDSFNTFVGMITLIH